MEELTREEFEAFCAWETGERVEHYRDEWNPATAIKTKDEFIKYLKYFEEYRHLTLKNRLDKDIITNNTK